MYLPWLESQVWFFGGLPRGRGTVLLLVRVDSPQNSLFHCDGCAGGAAEVAGGAGDEALAGDADAGGAAELSRCGGPASGGAAIG